MRIFFAPMEGVVDHPLRKLYTTIGGIDVFVTEFIRVTQSALPAKVFKRFSPELVDALQQPVRVQLLGSDPGWLAINAERAVRLGAPAIDLNFGCPAKTVNRHRGGACLLDEPALIAQIVRCVRDAVPENIPVTAKIRLGFNRRENYVENALAIEEAGASEITVHARSKADGYHPPAYWNCIGEINNKLTIPVIANGEIWSVTDFKQCRAQSGCNDFMLGRGLLARPDLALAIKAEINGSKHTAFSWPEVLELLFTFYSATESIYAEKYCGNRLKQWLMYLQKQYQEAEIFFNRVKKIREAEKMRCAFDEALRYFGCSSTVVDQINELRSDAAV